MAKQRTENVPPAALWKDTFSDLMNLLLCFFVLMFAMSNIDSQKFEEIAASLSSSFSVLPQGVDGCDAGRCENDMFLLGMFADIT